MKRGKSLEKRLRPAGSLLLLVFSLGTWAAAQELAWYCRPFGTINYRGEPVSEGLKVEAFIGGKRFAWSETGDGDYSLLIPKDDPATPEKEGWAEEDIVTIKVDGFTAFPSFKAFAGSQKHDLRVPTLDVHTTTWGKIKALFK
ncbi:MAG: hypothetical protein GTO24_24915 [candidate division Zixibacteria bacterium]|nr:hypothetical protein [candidate division Zixibacteria bacterium]